MSWVLSLDNAILDAIQRLRCPLLDWFMPLYSRLGDHGMVCIALAALLLLFPKTRRAGEAMALALVLCLFSGNLFLKPIVARVRPYEANQFVGLLVPPLGDFSFPSGHTFSCVAAAFVLFLRSVIELSPCKHMKLMLFWGSGSNFLFDLLKLVSLYYFLRSVLITVFP